MSKTIKVSDSTHARIGKRVKFGETLEDVIIEMLDQTDGGDARKRK